jgi:Homing endonuclease associated repeat
MAKDAMAKEELKKFAKEKAVEEQAAKEQIVAAIRWAAEELGRAPSRGELRRITGVSHYRVLAEFATLREAVRAAGLEPNPKGEKISTEDLLSDWKRVAEKLGRRPSRAEYVREGKYSAGALTVRFGSWGKISTTEDTENHRGRKARKAKAPERANHKGHEGSQRECNGDSVLHNFDRDPLAQLPAPLVGMRRVTEEVAQRRRWRRWW